MADAEEREGSGVGGRRESARPCTFPSTQAYMHTTVVT
jgi:hypothetical protein